jgi:putative nucleotidyltransferase with HDIG domain
VKENYLDRLKDLPIMPEVAAKVVNLSDSRLEISFKELETIIRVDPGLTTKILKIANSALYARQKEIKSLQMAITLLGFKAIKSLVLLITASSLFPHMRRTGFHPAYWKHSIQSAFLSRNIAARCGRSDVAEDAFIAGLLHDIGQAVLYNAGPDDYARVLEAKKLGVLQLEAIEEQVFGANHREVGGALLTKWNFPALYCDTALEHESLNITSPYKSTIILVSMACLLSDKMENGELPMLKRELVLQYLPYTCLTPADAEAPEAAFAPALAQDPLYREYQSLFSLA